MNHDLKNDHYPFLWCAVAKLLKTKELAEYLKLTEVTIYKHAKEGKIPALRVGGMWRFDKDQIDGFLKSKEEENTE